MQQLSSAVVPSPQTNNNFFAEPTSWGTNCPEDQQPWREGWGSHYYCSCFYFIATSLFSQLSTLLMPSLNYGTFQLDQLPLQPENGASLLWVKLPYLLLLLSMVEASMPLQTALMPGT